MPETFDKLHNYTFPLIGNVLMIPYLAVPNPSFKKKSMEYFTLLLKGEHVDKKIMELCSVGFQTEYMNTISLLKCIPEGHKGGFPVNDQTGKNEIPSDSIQTEDRVLAFVKCQVWTRGGKKGVQFQLEWIRKLIASGDNNSAKIGQDNGPTL